MSTIGSHCALKSLHNLRLNEDGLPKPQKDFPLASMAMMMTQLGAIVNRMTSKSRG